MLQFFFGFMSDFFKIQVCKLFFFCHCLCKHITSHLNRMNKKMLKMAENKNLNMCYDKWFKVKMRGTKETSSLEQNGFVKWAKWKLKSQNMVFFTYLKKNFQRNVTAIFDLIEFIFKALCRLIDTMKAQIKWSRLWITMTANP